MKTEKSNKQIVGFKIDRKKFRIIPFYNDRLPGPPISARILFEQYDSEVAQRP